MRNTRSSPPTSASVRGLSVLLLAASVLPGCEKTSHDNIDKWMQTEKGPGKLQAALADPGLDPDLRAHAGRNLIHMESSDKVLATLEEAPADKRGPTLERLVARLWIDARVEGELVMPSPSQVTAKDALFDVRRLAGDDLRRQIDDYLVDWLTGGYYAARARLGRYRGELVLRAIGPAAAAKLLRSAKSLLVPAGDDKSQFKLEEPLLVGLAATGSPEAAGFLLDLLTLAHNDKDLPKRSMDALYLGYVENQAQFEPADPAALVPHLDRLVELAKDESQPPRMANDAIRLIRITGPSHCIRPLIELIAFPHENKNFLSVTANAALLCGKTEALLPIADALPRKRGYSKAELDGTLVEPAVALKDPQAVAGKARTLLGSESWVARVLGVELLGRLAHKDTAAADAQAIRKLGRDKTRLGGWWGDQSDLPRRDRKKDPTLGQRAEEVAKQLDQLSKSG